MEEQPDNAKTGSGSPGVDTTPETPHHCDHWFAASAKYCGKRAEWRAVLHLTARLVLYRCREHMETLNHKYGTDSKVLRAERINWTW